MTSNSNSSHLTNSFKENVYITVNREFQLEFRLIMKTIKPYADP